MKSGIDGDGIEIELKISYVIRIMQNSLKFEINLLSQINLHIIIVFELEAKYRQAKHEFWET